MPRGRALLWLPPNSIYLSFKALGGSSGSPVGCRGCVVGEAELLQLRHRGAAARAAQNPSARGELPHCPTLRGVLPKSHCEGCAVPEQGLCGSAPPGNTPMELNTYKKEPPLHGAGPYGAQHPSDQSPGVIEQKLLLQQSTALKNNP